MGQVMAKNCITLCVGKKNDDYVKQDRRKMCKIEERILWEYKQLRAWKQRIKMDMIIVNLNATISKKHDDMTLKRHRYKRHSRTWRWYKHNEHKTQRWNRRDEHIHDIGMRDDHKLNIDTKDENR